MVESKNHLQTWLSPFIKFLSPTAYFGIVNLFTIRRSQNPRVAICRLWNAPQIYLLFFRSRIRFIISSSQEQQQFTWNFHNISKNGSKKNAYWATWYYIAITSQDSYTCFELNFFILGDSDQEIYAKYAGMWVSHAYKMHEYTLCVLL